MEDLEKVGVMKIKKKIEKEEIKHPWDVFENWLKDQEEGEKKEENDEA